MTLFVRGRLQPSIKFDLRPGIGEQLVLKRAGPGENLGALRRLIPGRHFDSRFVVVIQKGIELVILLLRDGIEFVIVTLGAGNRQSQPRAAHGIDAIDHRLDPELLRFDAAFHVHHGIAKESRGNSRIRCARRVEGGFVDQ